MRIFKSLTIGAIAMTSVAIAETAVNMEELNLYPERYAGKTITVEGVISMVHKDSALIEMKAGKLKDFSMALNFSEKDAAWEKAQYECASVQNKPSCAAKVTGVVMQNELFKDHYLLDNAKVEFLSK